MTRQLFDICKVFFVKKDIKKHGFHNETFILETVFLHTFIILSVLFTVLRTVSCSFITVFFLICRNHLIIFPAVLSQSALLLPVPAFPRPFSHGGFITIFVHVNAISFLYKISILFLCGFHYLLLHSYILFVLQYFFGIHSHFCIYKMTYYAYYKR